MESPTLKIRRVPLDSLHLDPANAREHGEENLEAILGSLKRFGQIEPLVVQKKTGRVIGGNGRLTVMKKLGWTECDVVEVDLDDLQATALGIALNRSSELASWNDATLAKLLEELKTHDALDGVGYSTEDIGRLLDDLEMQSAGDGDPDQVPEPPEAPLPRDPLHPSPHPSPSHSEGPTGKDPSSGRADPYDANIPVFPVLQGGGDLLDLADSLAHEPRSRALAKTAPAETFSFDPVSVPIQNREEWDVKVLKGSSTSGSQHPTSPQKPGRTGKGSGKETAGGEDPRRAWEEALTAVAGRWTAVAERYRAAGEAPPELDDSLDQELAEEVARAIRAEDSSRAIQAIELWRAAWLAVLDEPPAGWVEIESDLLGERVVVILRSDAAADARRARPELVAYDAQEIERLHGTKDGNLIRFVHFAKKHVGGRVQKPERSDGILAEYEGRVRQRSQGVHDVFAEARARLGSRDLEECSISSWIRKHAPAVAALWPQAPLTAAWLDWHQHVGSQHVEVLDSAWRAGLRGRK